MTRKFKQPDYTATPNVQISLGEAIPANHLARFVVDMVAQLDLSAIYKRYGVRGGEAIAPEALLALIFYGYSTGRFSSRKIERATYETGCLGHVHRYFLTSETHFFAGATISTLSPTSC